MAWQFDNQWGTHLSYTGCQAGLEVDERCALLDCKFRCFKSDEPEEPIKIMALLCPRDEVVEGKRNIALITRED